MSQQNIVEFLKDVPAERQHQLRFEELVNSPQEVLGRLCEFLDLEFQPEMVEPYKHKEKRMTDGIHPLSLMLGDVKFHQHSAIDARVAERWKEQAANDPLAAETWEVAETLGYRKAETRGGPKSLLVPIQPQGSLPPFFCVHPVGGGVFCYRELARYLGPDQPFYGIQARDVIRGQQPHSDLRTMAADYIEAMRSVQPEGPYRIGGWSLGGVTAFEIAQQLQRQGHNVSRLVLIDSVAPKVMNDVLSAPANLDGDHITEHEALETLTELCRTGTPDQIKEAFEEVRRSGFLPPEIAVEDFQHWLRSCQARVQLVRNYQATPFAGRIVLIKTSEAEYKHKAGQNNEDPNFGWTELAAGGLDVSVVAGSHYTVVLEPYVSDLARVLERYLA